MLKYLILLLLLLQCVTLQTQDEIVLRFKSDELLYVSDDNFCYKQFKQLSIDLLQYYTQDSTPIIRGYTFAALTEKGVANLEEILEQHLTDTARISVVFSGDMTYTTRMLPC